MKKPEISFEVVPRYDDNDEIILTGCETICNGSHVTFICKEHDRLVPFGMVLLKEKYIRGGL